MKHLEHTKRKAFPEGKEWLPLQGHHGQLVLFRLLCSVGGDFGLVMRHTVPEISEVEEEEGFAWLNWTDDHDFIEQMIQLSKKLVIRAVYHEQVAIGSYLPEIGYYYECDAAVRTVILTKARNWAKANKDKIKYPPDVEDNISVYLWK